MNGIIVSTPTPYRMVSALPVSASDGAIVFNTTDFTLYVWYDGAWYAQSGGGGGVGAGVDNLLIGDGENLLIADGEVLLI